MVKTIVLGGIDVAVKCTAATSVLYRMEFADDLIVSFNKYAQSIQEGEMPQGAVEMLERVAYIMARQADPKEKRTFVEWLDQFDDLMGFINDIGQIAEIMAEDRQTMESPKKNNEPQQE